MILEKAIIKPRHVEVQVFADSQGNTLYLGERDCSVQRRHQKVVEEAPCPIMTPELRAKMGEAAVNAAKSVNYRGAGTVEFLLDARGEFYFLEMNTRLQVEHPVTEMITGLDLVALQIQVAQGLPLGLTQSDITLDGHAIEVRLYTEDPSQDFLPASGPVDLWRPGSGVGVRVDSGIQSGQSISPFYDPMVAKLIGYGPTREVARLRLIGALRETALFGTPNNLKFLIQCLEKQKFIDGEATTAFIAEAFSEEDLQSLPASFADSAVAAVIDLSLDHEQLMSRSLQVSASLKDWSSASALVSRKQYKFGDCVYDLAVTPIAANTYRLTCINNPELSAEIELLSRQDALAVAKVNGIKQHAIFMQPKKGHLHCSVEGRSALYRDLIVLDGTAIEGVGGGRVVAPMHGMLLEVLVKSGDSVKKGQRLAVLEAMKMHYEILAEIDGTVGEVMVAAGTQVAADDLLLDIVIPETAMADEGEK